MSSLLPSDEKGLTITYWELIREDKLFRRAQVYWEFNRENRQVSGAA